MRTLITGANRGIGAALAIEGLRRGHDVTGTFRAAAAGDDIRWVQLDVTNRAAQEAAAQETGPLDLLVANAGVYLDKGTALADVTFDMLQDTFAANVSAVLLTVQAQMRNLSDGGRIAIISSAMGAQTRTPGNAFAYRASKAAALNLGRNLAEHLKPEGIAVGIYHPGWVRTDMGGSNADVSPEDSARGLWDRFEALDLTASGAFLAYDGTELPL
ncbi:MAG: SDR family NAD(P)-dependent oxidoreductase [Pseudomonadota bacterium]